jgi:sec-independent protein translocase protein TatC
MAAINGGRMPLLEHLRELRKRVGRSSLAVFLLSILGWFLYNQIIDSLAKPVCDLKGVRQTGAAHCGTLYINGVLGPLNLHITVAVATGVILSAPVWIYQLWAFVAPALHGKERRYSLIFMLVATPFFVAGAYLGYYILPTAVHVLLGFTPSNLTNLVRFDDYLNFVLRLILIFGIAFELPVFLVGLNFAGVISGASILKPWRLAVFGITLFTAAFTPTADPFTMLLLAVPMVLFYLSAGGIAILHYKRKAKMASS